MDNQKPKVEAPKYDPMAPDFVSDKDFCNYKMHAIMKIPSLAPEFKDFKVQYNVFQIGVGIGDTTPEYLCQYKTRMTGLHCANIRQANENDPLRCLRFMRKLAAGEMHPAIWMFMRSFAELVRVEDGERSRPKPMKEVITRAELEYGPAAVLEKTFAENARFAADIKKVASRREELVADKIRAEAPGLLYLGADGGGFVKHHIKAKTKEMLELGKMKEGDSVEFVFPEAVRNAEPDKP